MRPTSSSTSSSEPAGSGPGARWSGFPAAFALAGLALLAAYLGLAFAVDPYDTGRSALFARPGVRPQGPRTASASRGRDPAFQGAIVGNSHIQLVDPARLSAATGIPFVQLAIPATGPKEQLAVAEWFLRRHPDARGLVLAADEYWCADDPALTNAMPFPFWLVSASPLEYLRGLLRLPVAEEVVGRLGWLARKDPPRARPDGYWDYEDDYLKLGYPGDPRLAALRETRPPDAAAPGRAGPFPAASRLGTFLAGLPPELAVAVVLPPVYAAGLPRPGTPRAQAEAACKAALRGAVATRPRSAFLDWRTDRPEVRDPGLFFDQGHYRQPLARGLEADLAAALVAMRE